MPDQDLKLHYDIKGKLERVEKVIGDKVLVFGFNEKENKVILTERFSLNNRLCSLDDLWVSKVQFTAACKQASAIFKNSKYQSVNFRPPQPQLTFSFVS